MMRAMKPAASTGSLYVISTPIGNLEDLTFRAHRLLKEVQIVAAEDTRHTQKLLNHYQIRAVLTSYHDFNKEEKATVLIQKLKQGHSVAMVCDAGTPTISDPGYFLIRRCIEEGLSVIPVPGPSALLAAVSVSGLPTDAFLFLGFLPRKTAARRRSLERLAALPYTLVFFESPHRLIPTLQDLLAVLGDRHAVVARELTKRFEEVLHGNTSKLIEAFTKNPPRGEITLVVEGLTRDRKHRTKTIEDPSRPV
jgi:16S rRNA (cytidine1402-2'-O)-methyltransferase